MASVKALVAALLLGESAKKKVLRKTATRWSGLWMWLLVFDMIRFFRRRRRRIIARRVIKDGETLVVSSTVVRKKP